MSHVGGYENGRDPKSGLPFRRVLMLDNQSMKSDIGSKIHELDDFPCGVNSPSASKYVMHKLVICADCSDAQVFGPAAQQHP